MRAEDTRSGLAGSAEAAPARDLTRWPGGAAGAAWGSFSGMRAPVRRELGLGR
jgi:hypothetical protein